MISLYFIKSLGDQYAPTTAVLGPSPLHLGDDGETHDSKLCNSSSVCILLAGSAVRVVFLHISEEEEKRE